MKNNSIIVLAKFPAFAPAPSAPPLSSPFPASVGCRNLSGIGDLLDWLEGPGRRVNIDGRLGRSVPAPEPGV